MDISSLRERKNDRVFTVSEINGYIKNLFDSSHALNAVSVKGEISNFINHRSGHFYFSLKDGDSQIRAVMFRTATQKLKFALENGLKVTVRGVISVYQREGTYQIYVNSIEPDGIGALYLSYEQLKEKLSAEGLFEESAKKPIPLFPERIGVITSPTGAAIRDIINVTRRRFPLAKIYLYPSLVQGDGAVDGLIKALDYFERTNLTDVIIIGRGGGSIEDLWAFNSESLARKIFDMSIPIISAVGHEIDFTICDFVSDMRAPTPSAAAEIAVPDMRELVLRIDALYDRAKNALLRLTERAREKFDTLSEKAVLCEPLKIIDGRRAVIDGRYEAALSLINKIIQDGRTRLSLLAGKLQALNPLSVISRGYAIVERDGYITNTVSSLTVGDVLNLKLSDGTVTATVNKIYKNKRRTKNEKH